MKTTPYEITEWPEKTLFTRQEAAQILQIQIRQSKTDMTLRLKIMTIS